MNKETLKQFDNSLKLIVFHYRKLIVWGITLALLAWLFIAVQGIVVLLLVSYGVALLIDPLVTRLEKKRIPRGVSVSVLMCLLLLAVVLIVIVAIPVISGEYSTFVNSLSEDLSIFNHKIEQTLHNWFNIDIQIDLAAKFENLKGRLISVYSEDKGRLFDIVRTTLFKGYSVTLTLVNLVMLPFFIFYMTRDLEKIHLVLGSFLPANISKEVAAVGSEVVSYTRAFFRGQLTIAFIMVFLYSIALWMVGAPFAFFIGFIAGLIGIIPYVGFAIGLFLGMLVTTVYNPSLSQYIYVLLAFVIPSTIESFVLQPKILGKSVGFNPLTVIIILLIGGQLFGIIGLLLAVPVAAATLVIMRNIFENVGIKL